jgi:hypothetical protein
MSGAEFTDGSLVFGTAVVPELWATRVPRTVTAVDLQVALQRFTNQADEMLRANPALARDYLSLKGYQSLVRGSPAARLNYGNALEELTAEIVADDPEWSYFFMYQAQRRTPGASVPDFIGFDGRQMHVFDITTHNQIAAHQNRWYGGYAHYITYDGLPDGLVFPP